MFLNHQGFSALLCFRLKLVVDLNLVEICALNKWN